MFRQLLPSFLLLLIVNLCYNSLIETRNKQEFSISFLDSFSDKFALINRANFCLPKHMFRRVVDLMKSRKTSIPIFI